MVQLGPWTTSTFSESSFTSMSSGTRVEDLEREFEEAATGYSETRVNVRFWLSRRCCPITVDSSDPCMPRPLARFCMYVKYGQELERRVEELEGTPSEELHSTQFALAKLLLFSNEQNIQRGIVLLKSASEESIGEFGIILVILSR